MFLKNFIADGIIERIVIRNQNEPKLRGPAPGHECDKASKFHPLEMTLHGDSQAHPRREICKFL